MKFYLGVTDNSRFDYLSEINPEDVNFWQPSGTTNFQAIPPGAPFFFKLKRPRNHIGGLGFFSSHTKLPISIAWDTFHERNGCANFDEFKAKIQSYRKDTKPNPNIGCIVLTNPIFFNKRDWVPAPSDWGKSIVQGKGYETTSPIGQDLWMRLSTLLEQYITNRPLNKPGDNIVSELESPQYGSSILTKVRLGQGAFRVLVTDAYQRRCSITGEKTLPLLEAAHIKSYAKSGPHSLANGLLLRSDMHKLFDTGYLTITSEFKVEVSSRIKEEFQNGREYYQYHGKSLLYLPNDFQKRPNQAYIEWHNSNIYRS
jgi:putative restriction endonuclease